MVKNHSMGLSLLQNVKQLEQRYIITRQALYVDWRRRSRWLKDLLSIGDPETFWLDLIATHRDIKRLATLEYLKGDNSAARIGALRLIRDLNLDMMDLMENYDYEKRLQSVEERVGKLKLRPDEIGALR